MEKLIERYGLFWERAKMFKIKDGRVEWTDDAWPEKSPPLEGAKGIYVLNKGSKATYVGIAIKGKDPIATRIHEHTKDWLSPWWDNVSWYAFTENIKEEVIKVIESLMVGNIDGLYNGVEPQEHIGKLCHLRGASNFAQNELWRKQFQHVSLE